MIDFQIHLKAPMKANVHRYEAGKYNSSFVTLKLQTDGGESQITMFLSDIEQVSALAKNILAAVVHAPVVVEEDVEASA